MSSRKKSARQRGGSAFAQLYRTSLWQRLRKAQLEKEPLCCLCQARGQIVPATVCNHTNGHPPGETEQMFWSGPFDSQCVGCHSGDTARLENGRVQIKGCDIEGWPIDAGMYKRI